MSNGTEKQARVITTILSALTEYDDPADRRYIMVCAVASMFRMDERDPYRACRVHRGHHPRYCGP